jgi:hypothetical protein
MLLAVCFGGVLTASTGLAQGFLPAPAVQPQSKTYFSELERAQIVQYWNAPGRYEVGARLDAVTSGPYMVRLTPEASTWFWNYNRFIKPGKLAPGKDPKATDPFSLRWETWIEAKLKYDRAQAQIQADAANAQLKAGTIATAWLPDGATALPPHPGPMPADLLAAVGNAPPFAACVAPQRHVVHFDSGETISYNDYLAPGSPRYAYFRFPQGVSASGTSLSKIAPEELDRIFAVGNMTPTETRVMRAISLLEGGFDSINTYDTGYISVGFIQFAALEDGSGSLSDLLSYEKKNAPDAFAQDFRAFGIDVTDAGTLVAVDPSTGAELVGKEAVRKVVDEKRLAAVFHLAGMRSLSFRAAQLYVAKRNYYPADLPVQATVNGQILTGKVSDVILSEAGLATLFDRKVNTGNIRTLNDVMSQTMAKYGLTTLDQLLPYEREMIAGVRWRTDFLKDKTLSQPD